MRLGEKKDHYIVTLGDDYVSFSHAGSKVRIAVSSVTKLVSELHSDQRRSTSTVYFKGGRFTGRLWFDMSRVMSALALHTGVDYDLSDAFHQEDRIREMAESYNKGQV